MHRVIAFRYGCAWRRVRASSTRPLVFIVTGPTLVLSIYDMYASGGRGNDCDPEFTKRAVASLTRSPGVVATPGTCGVRLTPSTRHPAPNTQHLAPSTHHPAPSTVSPQSKSRTSTEHTQHPPPSSPEPSTQHREPATEIVYINLEEATLPRQAPRRLEFDLSLGSHEPSRLSVRSLFTGLTRVASLSSTKQAQLASALHFFQQVRLDRQFRNHPTRSPIRPDMGCIEQHGPIEPPIVAQAHGHANVPIP
jgi:hypothetical protein